MIKDVTIQKGPVYKQNLQSNLHAFLIVEVATLSCVKTAKPGLFLCLKLSWTLRNMKKPSRLSCLSISMLHSCSWNCTSC